MRKLRLRKDVSFICSWHPLSINNRGKSQIHIPKPYKTKTEVKVKIKDRFKRRESNDVN